MITSVGSVCVLQVGLVQSVTRVSACLSKQTHCTMFSADVQKTIMTLRRLKKKFFSKNCSRVLKINRSINTLLMLVLMLTQQGFSSFLSLLVPACPAGFYGQGCSQTCACQNTERCHAGTGECVCTAGWTGLNCSDSEE